MHRVQELSFGRWRWIKKTGTSTSLPFKLTLRRQRPWLQVRQKTTWSHFARATWMCWSTWQKTKRRPATSPVPNSSWASQTRCNSSSIGDDNLVFWWEGNFICMFHRKLVVVTCKSSWTDPKQEFPRGWTSQLWHWVPGPTLKPHSRLKLSHHLATLRPNGGPTCTVVSLPRDVACGAQAQVEYCTGNPQKSSSHVWLTLFFLIKTRSCKNEKALRRVPSNFGFIETCNDSKNLD